jgi:predicted enzyme related to lactoylglutathione lyase
MSRVIHFEIHADNPERAIAFYTQLFGWEFAQWGEQEYWLIATGDQDKPGINGGLLRRNCDAEIGGVGSFVCTVDVDDVDASVAALQAAGGIVAMSKMAVPTIGWLAYGKDTEGNLFGMMQADAQAA